MASVSDRRHLLAGAAAFLASILVALLGLYARAESPAPVGGVVKLRLLRINDLHGHVEPVQDDLGGAAWLAARKAAAPTSRWWRSRSRSAAVSVGRVTAPPVVSVALSLLRRAAAAPSREGVRRGPTP